MAQDYNATINLPKTDFPMRAGLPKREPDMLKRWAEQDIYNVALKKSEGKHTIDVRPEETLLVKRKKDYYISVRVVDSDTDGYLFMKAYLKKGVYRRHVVGKERRYPICPAIRVKGYEVAK